MERKSTNLFGLTMVFFSFLLLSSFGAVAFGGTISGQVGGGVPLAGICVNAVDNRCNGNWFGAQTDAFGNYIITNLPEGTYYVNTHASCAGTQYYVDEWWDGYGGTLDCNQAGPVNVAAAQDVTNINFILELGGIIFGRVTDLAGQPLVNVCVDAGDSPCQGHGNWYHTGTDQDGYYNLVVPEGIYYVRSNPGCDQQNYVLEWWDTGAGTLDCDQAAPVEAFSGQETGGINFALAPGGSASGRVSDTQGNPIPNLQLFAVLHSCGPSWLGGINTDVNGNYRITGLPAGDNYVRACPSCSGLNYVDEWYDDVTDCNQAAPVSVVVGQDMPGINFSLDQGGTITGRVTDPQGNPIPSVPVSAFAGPCWGNWTGGTQTDGNGNYFIVVPGGDYYVIAQPGVGQLNYLTEWWDGNGGTVDCNQAAIVHAAAGQGAGGIDFALEPGGSVSGRITDDLGNPIPNLNVYADSQKCGGNWLGNGNTNQDGNYTIFGLPGGNTYVATCANCSGLPYIDEWYDNTTDCNQAGSVAITVGQDTPDIDFSLEEGGSLSGRITDAQGNPISNVPVTVYHNRCGNGWAGGTQTDQNGDYTVWGLPVGAYFVTAHPKCNMPVNYGNQWWNGASGTSDCNLAAPVNIIAGPTTSGIDFSLVEGAPYPPPMFRSVDMFSIRNPDGSMGTVFYAFIDGPSPEDVCSLTATGPLSTFNFGPATSFRQLGLIYVSSVNFVVVNGMYEFRLTDSMGRTVSETRNFVFDGAVPQIDPGTMNPPHESYVGTTTPILSGSLPATSPGESTADNLRYQVMVQDYQNNAIWYASKYQETPTFTVPEGLLQPNTPYWWFVRVIDLNTDGRNRTQSASMSFYTGTKGTPEIDTGGLISLPTQGNTLNYLYGRGINVAPWDVASFEVTGPDLADYDLLQRRDYGFQFPMFNANITFLDPPTASIPDGAYRFEIEDDLGGTASVVRSYAYNPVPDFLSDSRLPAENAYFDATGSPTFSWSRVAGDTGDGKYRYSIRIMDYHNRVRWYDAPYSTNTTFTLPETVNLPRGSSYKWRVNVYGPGVPPGTDTNNFRSSSFRTFTLNPFNFPKPEVKVNGQDGPVFLPSPGLVDVEVSLNPGDMPGAPMEWWIGVLSSIGNYWFAPTLNWVPSNTPISVGQIGLFDLAPYPLLTYDLPTGIYTFFFVLDKNANGVLDELTWYDYVNVFISPDGMEMESASMSSISNDAFLEKIKVLMKQ